MKLYCDVSCCESLFNPLCWVNSVSPFKFETHIFILALFLLIYLIILSLWIFLFSNLEAPKSQVLDLCYWLSFLPLSSHYLLILFSGRFPHLHLSTEYFIFQSAFLFFLFFLIHTITLFLHMQNILISLRILITFSWRLLFLTVALSYSLFLFIYLFQVSPVGGFSLSWLLATGSVFISKNDILKKGDWNLCTCSKFHCKTIWRPIVFLFISFFSSGILLSQYLQRFALECNFFKEGPFNILSEEVWA